MKEYGNFIAYHGSSMENWYSISRNSLQNYSETVNMTNGAAFGKGIYFWFVSIFGIHQNSEDLRVSRDFSKAGPTWNKSKILGTNLSCVCVCEIVKHESVKILQDDKKVKNSYIIVPNSGMLNFHIW